MLVEIEAISEDTNKYLGTILINPEHISAVTFSPDGLHLKTCDGSVYLIRSKQWLLPASEESPIIRYICDRFTEELEDESIDYMLEKYGQPDEIMDPGHF